MELDGRLYERLCRTFPAGGPVRLYHQDFLTWPLPKSDYVVFANIPFSITSAILRRLTQGSHPPREAWLVMEKGAAKRYMGRPETTRKSLLLAPWFDCDIAYHFRREDFHPGPRGGSGALPFQAQEAPTCPGDSTGRTRPFANAVSAAEPDALRRILTRQPADGGSARCGPATGFPLGRYAVCPMALPVPMGRTVRQNRRLASSTWNGGIRAY